jgi:hypothetical protein
MRGAVTPLRGTSSCRGVFTVLRVVCGCLAQRSTECRPAMENISEEEK